MNDQQNLLLRNEMSQHKKHKKRTKNLLLQLKDQIEFYFSDANLQKDRFLNQEINKHPDRYVAISMIASFNRVKQKTSDLSLVLKAMKMSALLEVSEDGMMVKRKTPVPEPRNVDKETVYVEKLPPYADHDWIKEIFSKCGKVLYVSIPRFKQTGEIKGFAFVEFETSKQARDAIQMFNKGSKLSYGGGENGSSADKLNEQHKTKGKRKRSHSESDLEMQKHREQKRKRTTSESSVDSSEADQHGSVTSSVDLKQKGKEKALHEKNKEDDQPKEKETETRRSSVQQDCRSRKGKKSVRWNGKQESTLKGNKTVKTDISSTAGVKRPLDASDWECDGDDDEQKGGEWKQLKSVFDSDCRVVVHDNDAKEAEANEGSKKQKKRKRKKKERKETRLPHLRVISKLDWLELKNEYKNLQRQAMKNLKQQLQEKSSNDPIIPQQREQKKPKKSDSGNAGKEKYEKRSDKGLIELSYIPGVVLKFQCQRQETKKELREKFSSCAPVAYLELAEDNVQGHVRFHTAENCTSVWKDMSSANREIKVERLTEEEERSYWKKINADRKARFNSKREKKRGAEKVARKAEALQVKLQSHVRFHDYESEET